jgi:hypothetical protein
VTDINENFTLGPRKKVERANQHISDIKRDSISLPDRLFSIERTPADSNFLRANSTAFGLRYKVSEPLVYHFGSLIGDAVNNLREALDHLLMRALDYDLQKTEPRGKLHFPFAESQAILLKSKYFLDVASLSSNVSNIIAETVRPTKDDNLPLWAVSKFNNFNKHNDFVATIRENRIEGLSGWVGTNRFSFGRFAIEENSKKPLLGSNEMPIIDRHPTVTVELKFGEFEVFSLEHVIPKLEAMSAATMKAIEQMKSHLQREPHRP